MNTARICQAHAYKFAGWRWRVSLLLLFYQFFLDLKNLYSNDDDEEMSAEEEEVSTDEDMSETFSPDITFDEDLPPMYV